MPQPMSTWIITAAIAGLILGALDIRFLPHTRNVGLFAPIKFVVCKMIFYPLHAVLIREQLTVTTDKRGTYKATPRGVLVLNKPLTVPIITDEINSEPVERVWKSAVDMEFDNASRTAFTAPMTARKRELLRGLEPGE